jgi:DNA-binding NarL/FixJ family response regulator
VGISISCLLIVERPELVSDVRLNLDGINIPINQIKVVNSLADAISVLAVEEVEVVILDMDLVDSSSLKTLTAIRAVTDAAIIVVSDMDDDILGVNSIKHGADDFIYRGEINSKRFHSIIAHSTARMSLRIFARKVRQKIGVLERLIVG